MSLALASRRAAISPAWVKNPLWRTARAVPSLDLPFADTKSLTDAVTGQSLVTFTRASSGTYVDSQGVIRTATTNLLLRSEEFETTWTNTNSTESTNVIVAPNGALTADLLLADATTTASARDIRQNANGTVASTHTFSVYAKAKDGNFLGMAFRNQASAANFCSAEFNLSNGTVSIAGTNGGNATGALASITNIGDGWYRCSLSGIADTSGTQFTVILIGRTSSNSNSVIANTELVYLWGAQLEQSSTVGEYIPTTSTINSAPRFDHNPTTGESLGLLVEEQRTNLLLRSEEFGTTWTSFGNTVSVNTASAPDSLATADTLIPNSGQSTSGVTQVVPGGLPDSTTYTFSVFIKFAGLTAFNLQFYNKANTFFGSRNFNPQTGQLSGAEFGGTTSVVAYPNGWYRLILANVNSGTGAIAPNARIVCSTTGDGTSGAYIWGAQLEAGSFPTSYIPTTTAAATRSADVASITGTAFSSWYRQDEGTVFAEYRLPAAGIGIVDIGDGTANNVMPVFVGAAVLQAASVNAIVGGVNSGRLDSGGSFVANSLNRAAYAIKVADRALSANGATATASATPSAMPVVTQLQIQGTTNFAAGKGGTIRRLTYWPARLSNSTIQAITQ